MLFGVTTTSSHFVTTVSPESKGKRLAFNGWYQSSWEPKLDEDLEELLAARTELRSGGGSGSSGVTHFQLESITRMLNDPWQNIPAERKESLSVLQGGIMDELWPNSKAEDRAGQADAAA